MRYILVRGPENFGTLLIPFDLNDRMTYLSVPRAAADFGCHAGDTLTAACSGCEASAGADCVAEDDV